MTAGVDHRAPSRCSGHCCAMFTLPIAPQDVEAEYRRFIRVERGDASRPGPSLQDIEILAPMLVSLGMGPLWERASVCGPVEYSPIVFENAEGVQKSLVEFWYGCRNLLPNGNCGIYDRRPQLCADYPYNKACDYAGCTSRSARSGFAGGETTKRNRWVRGRHPVYAWRLIEAADEWR